MIYVGNYGGIPSAGARNIVGIRICHAGVDACAIAGANTICNETSMSPLTFGGGTYSSFAVK